MVHPGTRANPSIDIPEDAHESDMGQMAGTDIVEDFPQEPKAAEISKDCHYYFIFKLVEKICGAMNGILTTLGKVGKIIGMVD